MIQYRDEESHTKIVLLPEFTSLKKTQPYTGYIDGIHLFATFASQDLLAPRSKSLGSPSKTARIQL